MAAQLTDALISAGVIDAGGVNWARMHQEEHSGALDTALLELDLVDEEALLRGLTSTSGLTAATPSDLVDVDAALSKSLPEGLTDELRAYPLRIVGNKLIAVVHSPIADNQLGQLHCILGHEVTQRVAPSHYIDMVRARLRGVEPGERTTVLEARLARRRAAGDFQNVLQRLADASSLSTAAAGVLDYAGHLVDFACLLFRRESTLRVVAACRSGQASRVPLPCPDPDCTLAATIRYGGYFLGPIVATDADQAFYRGLGRPIPRRALVVPIPIAERLVFYADNADRGIATRWVAELTLLVARLGQQVGRFGSKGVLGLQRSSKETAPVVPSQAVDAVAQAQSCSAQHGLATQAEVEGKAHELPSQEPPPDQGIEREAANRAVAQGQDTRAAADLSIASASAGEKLPDLTVGELAAMHRLRRAADEAGMGLEAFVDGLLQDRASRAATATATALAGEVKGLFDRLATDIPTQLARGIESAFRQMVPRLGSPPSAAPIPPDQGVNASAATEVEVIKQEPPGPREVPSYRSRRGKLVRVDF